MLLESLLLVVAAAPQATSTIGSLFKELLPYAALLYSFYNNYQAKNNSASQKVADAIKHLESVTNNHTIMHTAHQQERERLVDLNNQWKSNIEAKLNNVDNLVGEVQHMKARLDTQYEQITNLKERIKELSDNVKETNKELKDTNRELVALVKMMTK
jgi:predicted  nucleic acid-binding Zn-ribbon protein